jgi:hypothetical protein
MPRLKAIVDSLDGIPEPLQELYTLKDGRYFLDADGVEDVTGLKNAHESEKAARKAAKEESARLAAQLKAFEGIDPAKYKELTDKLAEIDKNKEAAEKEALEKKGAWDQLHKQLTEKHSTELAAVQAALDKVTKDKDARIASITGLLETHLVDAQATSAIAAAKGVPELLLPAMKPFIRVVEKDGEFQVVVLDKAGQPRIANGKGEPFTIGAFVTELASDPVYARAFEPSGAGGSGARPGAGTGGGGNGAKKTIPRGDQAAFNANLEQIAKGEVTFTD